MILRRAITLYQCGAIMDDGDSLLTPEERETQRQWDVEHTLRARDLQRRAQSALDRRRYLHGKLRDLNVRWRDLEDRRVNREQDYCNRLLTMYGQKTFTQ